MGEECSVVIIPLIKILDIPVRWNLAYDDLSLLPLSFAKELLRPACEEDEIPLIFVGGVQGLVAGGLQVVIFYS